MTQQELYQVAELAWEDCDACDAIDKGFWINGFVRAANLFGDIENLPSPQQLEEIGWSVSKRLKSHLNSISSEQFEKEINDIETEGYTSGPTMEVFINNQQDLDPEFGKIISDNFNDLI